MVLLIEENAQRVAVFDGADLDVSEVFPPQGTHHIEQRQGSKPIT